ncbi:UBX domain-containing protein [Heracleum sosnowskyi]|uniref:UBX domain-containing protein n=1 Tax=Heracleum sosnowskyi TaxID=360622 RepID=A0AAD8H4C8_9APIA|nr:UBX domain-containing protein [Heracleum sosnowskyi]
MLIDSPSAFKRRRFTTMDPLEAESSKAKLLAAKEKFGRDIRVFETSVASQTQNDFANSDEQDNFYEFTPEDYYRILATKKQDNFLKTRKIRESEQAARRSRITKAVIRVRFPDNNTLEATFHPSETIQRLFDLLMKVLAQPDLPYYLYTTPPKKQIKDLSEDFYSAGFVPGAIVYFSQNMLKGHDGTEASGPFLLDEVMSLKGLDLVAEETGKVQPAEAMRESAVENPSAAVQDQKPTEKKTVKPKWLKM